MVAEPKPHQTGRKRQNMAKTGNDWDYYYDSYYAAAVAPRLVPPLKRPRLMVAQTRSTKNATATATTTATTANASSTTIQSKGFTAQTNNGISVTAPPNSTSSNDQIKIYSNPDILICGNCREMFTELQDLLDHKKSYCKLRFTCKCNTINGVKSPSNRKDAAALLCVQCKDAFVSAWDLMVHVQAAHMVNIYELGVPKCANGARHSSPCASPARKNGLDEDPLGQDDVRPESPDSEKHRESDSDQLIDAMDTEASESCGSSHAGPNHVDAVARSTDAAVPASIGKRMNGEASGPE